MTRRLISAAAAGALLLAGCGGGSSSSSTSPAVTTSVANTTASSSATSTTSARPRPRPRPPARAPFRVRLRVLTLVDHSRTLPGSSTPRTVVTIVRFPEGAPGRRPLVVFGHGFAVTPAPYARLLDAWARAGYVVAAPVFPLGNGNAPGGPNERDLVNQPRDMSFVISQLLALYPRLIDRREVAVTGQSDGGDTALAVAFDPRFRDPRVGAAMILSGEEIPFLTSFSITSPHPPLLAVQGTADTINPPSFTHAFYDNAPPTRYLLSLLGASHLPPYTDQQPQLGVVERVTTAFLDLYLQGRRAALRTMIRSGNVPGVATINSGP